MASTPPPSFSGVVMAGGKSSRMKRNKALIALRAGPLWRRQYDLLVEAGATENRISMRRDDDWAPPEIPRVFDDGMAGPLGGLLAALEACTCTHLIVLAVDLPEMPACWFQGLRSVCSAGRGAVGWQAEVGAYEPLAAIYPRELAVHAREAFARGDFCLQTLVSSAVADDRFEVQTILPEQLGWFANWNRPQDVSRL